MTYSTNIHKFVLNFKDMKELVLFSLVVYGITNIVVYGKIFNNIRTFAIKINPSFLGQLMTCMMCSGTWAGFIVSSTLYYFNLHHLSPMVHWGINIPWLAIFLDGCLASGTTWGINVILEYFEYNTPPE